MLVADGDGRAVAVATVAVGETRMGVAVQVLVGIKGLVAVGGV